jgi:hypothetical protein
VSIVVKVDVSGDPAGGEGYDLGVSNAEPSFAKYTAKVSTFVADFCKRRLPRKTFGIFSLQNLGFLRSIPIVHSVPAISIVVSFANNSLPRGPTVAINPVPKMR